MIRPLRDRILARRVVEQDRTMLTTEALIAKRPKHATTTSDQENS